MRTETLRIDGARLLDRLHELAKIGLTAEGGCCRLALTDEDRAGRDLVVGWMKAAGLQVSMTSGAGHDAQMLARLCPTAMIFVPSVRGISHNPAEHTEPGDLEAGGNVLLQTLLELAR